ncbi:dihydropteroate synthase [Helicobacter turcicus]|uniref:dihydropteroate synthase n=1 Tax=Helicobacter turcicus TaxID=2867412 RepID=A0ABS7JNI2_9HELI|nr:dihydropteroate synthase [Helicobacter turcicus]MBX7490951.1 dihydropteroate synthase [Helicobacter turcicus]MBX7545805.1 dihydropteroate synthase [Helicobacter turcicus]
MAFVQYLEDSKLALEQLNCDSVGYGILRNKDKVFNFLVKNLKVPAAHILKQEALAVGADFALPRDAILYTREFYDGILMLTRAQSKALLKKLKIQPFGLKKVAHDLEAHLRFHNITPKIMGVINITPDSFYAKSRKNSKNAESSLLKMIEEGVDILDIGAASTRPSSAWVSEEEEHTRLSGILEFIKREKIYEKVILSIDTYTPSVAKKCLDYGFLVVNDITGFSNTKMLEAVRGYDCECVVMHMQGSPKEMQENPNYKDLFLEMDTFFAERIAALVAQNNTKIILDVGIGFGKTLAHNCALIQHLGHFLHFGYPLLVGASRKSMIDKITPCDVENRLSGTLAIHLESLNHGASIIRCHDIAEHLQALKVWQAIQNVNLLL